MPTSGGVAQISLSLDPSDPQPLGAISGGTSPLGSRSDHVHPLLLPIGVYVGSDGYPQLETTSTLPYIWIPSNHYLAWDSTDQLFLYG